MILLQLFIDRLTNILRWNSRQFKVKHLITTVKIAYVYLRQKHKMYSICPVQTSTHSYISLYSMKIKDMTDYLFGRTYYRLLLIMKLQSNNQKILLLIKKKKFGFRSYASTKNNTKKLLTIRKEKTFHIHN